MYHNTTDSVAPELLIYARQASKQSTAILRFFDGVSGCYSPSQVCELVFKNSVPLTSVRRAITDLTGYGRLEKTTRQRTGPYGRPEYCWRRARGQIDLL